MTRAEEIIGVALELFAEKGYDATSIQDITARVNIKKATFYSHFTSKKDLFVLIMKQQADRVVRRTNEIIKESSGKDIKDLLFNVFDSQVRMSFDRKHLLFWKRLVLNQAGTSDEQLQAQIAETMEDVNDTVMSALKAAIMDSKSFPRGKADPECLSKCVQMFFIILQGFLDWILVSGCPEPGIVRQAWGCFWNGMASGVRTG